jgi:signal transduction histidine kinase
VLFGLVAALLALGPLLLWRSERAEAIRADFDEQLVEQMEVVQRAWIINQRDIGFAAWFVDATDEWNEPFVDTDLEPPLYTWVRDTGEWPGFRSFAVDGTTFGAYIRPTEDGQAFVTVADSGSLADDLDAIDQRTWLLVAGLVVVCVGLGWLGAGLALGPTRRMLTAQQDFLADAAHEMRTPLAVITASSSQALARARSNEEYVRSLSEIRSAAERASTGVNELLDLVRFDSGQAIPRLAPLRLDLLAEEVAASVRDDGCAVVAEPSDPVVVDADMALVRQAIENVVRNAVRRATKVEMTSRVEDRHGVIEIADDGPGFDPAKLDSVFERYQRGDQRGDTGIGLTIVKAIVEANGGTVDAANADTGGAVITIRLPLTDR